MKFQICTLAIYKVKLSKRNSFLWFTNSLPTKYILTHHLVQMSQDDTKTTCRPEREYAGERLRKASKPHVLLQEEVSKRSSHINQRVYLLLQLVSCFFVFLQLRLNTHYFADQVTNITEERRETQGNCLLCLKTKNGIIKLLFEDEMQSKIWISTILNLLEMQNLHIY